jgi:hypothetical protein
MTAQGNNWLGIMVDQVFHLLLIALAIYLS